MMADDLRSDMEKGFSGVRDEFTAVRAEIATQGPIFAARSRPRVAAVNLYCAGESLIADR